MIIVSSSHLPPSYCRLHLGHGSLRIPRLFFPYSFQLLFSILSIYLYISLALSSLIY